ncbi:MAG: hypothetical protein M1153_01285 [Patescibacteria group bacterium]|nr:hypothetical protein [Patescibacteria group bacterium]
MEEAKGGNHSQGCRCEICSNRCAVCGGYHWTGGSWVWRALVAVIILTITFWCGIKIGEVKGYVEAGYGGYETPYGGMFWGYGTGNGCYRYGPGMMYYYPQGGTGNTAPSSGSGSTAK